MSQSLYIRKIKLEDGNNPTLLKLTDNSLLNYLKLQGTKGLVNTEINREDIELILNSREVVRVLNIIEEFVRVQNKDPNSPNVKYVPPDQREVTGKSDLEASLLEVNDKNADLSRALSDAEQKIAEYEKDLRNVPAPKQSDGRYVLHTSASPKDLDVKLNVNLRTAYQANEECWAQLFYETAQKLKTRVGFSEEEYNKVCQEYNNLKAFFETPKGKRQFGTFSQNFKKELRTRYSNAIELKEKCEGSKETLPVYIRVAQTTDKTIITFPVETKPDEDNYGEIEFRFSKGLTQLIISLSKKDIQAKEMNYPYLALSIPPGSNFHTLRSYVEKAFLTIAQDGNLDLKFKETNYFSDEILEVSVDTIGNGQPSGDNIEEILAQNFKGVTDFQRRTGLSGVTFYKWKKSGSLRPHKEVTRKMAGLLGCSTEYFAGLLKKKADESQEQQSQ